MKRKRTAQVEGLIQAQISDILRTRIKDPSIGFVTVTEVSCSNDLRNAKIFFSILGDEAQKKMTFEGLLRARSFIQKELGSRIRLRYLPILQFQMDRSLDYSEKIENLLNQLESGEERP